MPGNPHLYYSISNPEQLNPVVMLLLHGAGSNHLVWPANLRRNTGAQVIAVDLPGHGRSPGVPEQSIEGYVLQVVRFLDDMGIYRVFLAGHSMGGAIGMQICKSYPERLSGLALISCGTTLPVPGRTLELLSNPGSIQEAIASLEPILFGSAASSNLKKQILKSMINNRPGLLYSDWLACTRFDMRSGCGIMSKRVWAAVGREDQIIGPAAVRQLSTLVPRSRITYFEEAGHMLVVEKPVELSTWLLSIASRLSTQTRSGS